MDYGTLAFNIVAAIVKIAFIILGFLMPLASILTWMERRQSAMMQDRLGPNRAYIALPFTKWRPRAWGITHFIADLLVRFCRAPCPRRDPSVLLVDPGHLALFVTFIEAMHGSQSRRRQSACLS